MGTWYAVKGVEHTNLNATPNKPGSTKDCRTLTLTQNQGTSTITFQWNENNIIVFKANNDNTNLWQSISNSQKTGNFNIF